MKLMSFPPALESICLKPSSCQAPVEPAGAPGWMAGQEDSLTTKTGGPTLSHPHFVPTILPATPRHGSSAGTKTRLGHDQGCWENSGIGGLTKKVGCLGTRDFHAVHTSGMVYEGLSRDFPGTP